MSHETCGQHVSVMMGVAYCERHQTVYVYPWDVVPSDRRRVAPSPADFLFFAATVGSIRSVWPGKRVKAAVLLMPGERVQGLSLDGLDPDKLKDWNDAEKRQ